MYITFDTSTIIGIVGVLLAFYCGGYGTCWIDSRRGYSKDQVKQIQENLRNRRFPYV